MQNGQLVSTALYRCEDCSGCPCRAQCCRAKDPDRPKELVLKKTFWEKREQAEKNIMTQRGSICVFAALFRWKAPLVC